MQTLIYLSTLFATTEVIIEDEREFLYTRFTECGAANDVTHSFTEMKNMKLLKKKKRKKYAKRQRVARRKENWWDWWEIQKQHYALIIKLMWKNK